MSGLSLICKRPTQPHLPRRLMIAMASPPQWPVLWLNDCLKKLRYILFKVHKLSSCFLFTINVWSLFNLQKTHTMAPPKMSHCSHGLSSSMARPVVEGLPQETGRLTQRHLPRRLMVAMARPVVEGLPQETEVYFL